MNILIIWLWNHWKKYVNFFEGRNWNIYWICKTQKTKNYIEANYNIKVFTDYSSLINEIIFDFIVLALPSDIQWKIAIDIVTKVPKKTNILIELPVSDFKEDRIELEKYDNIGFFVEEYYSLLSKFLSKIDTSKIEKINVVMNISEEDFWDKKSENIDKIHLMNNFILSGISYDIFDIKINKHQDLNVYYKVTFDYLWKFVEYSFYRNKTLKIWTKSFDDRFNFDEVVTSIINDFSYVSKSKLDFNNYFKNIINK